MIWKITDRARLVRLRHSVHVVDDFSDLTRHAWMSYMVDKSPVEDTLLQRQIRPWEPKKHVPVLTASRSAFKTYST